MIKAKHHPVIYPIFKWLSRFLIKRNFNTVQIETDYIENDCPVLLVANHISWWDGFWMEYLNQKILHRKFHVMMLEEQLTKRRYFRYAGSYSIKKNSREVKESIDYTIDLIKNRENMVLMFPQGRIYSAYNYTIHFEKGIQQILKKCRDDLQVVFTANFTEFFSDAKPTLYIYTYTRSAAYLKNKDLETEYTRFYNRTLDKHKQRES